MYVAPLTEIDQVPTLGAMVGSLHSDEILAQINGRYGSNAVVFSQGDDPYFSHYQNFMALVQHQTQVSDQYVLNTARIIENPNLFRPIETEQDLAVVPQCMQIPLLMMPDMRTLLENGQIWGWGWDPDTLPEEDVYGRLLNNGKFTVDFSNKENPYPETFEWLFKSTDPDLTDEQLEAIDRSRQYLHEFIERELASAGTRRDPTDLANSIGVAKHKK